MARIRTYQLDENLSTSDYLLGNDGDSGSAITKRFNLEDLREFFTVATDLSADDLPQGYIPTNNQQGTAWERSPLQVQHTNELGPHVLLADGTTATFDMFFLTLSNGQQVLRFENYNEPFYLPDFVGREFLFKVEGDDIDDPFQMGTFQEYRGFIKEDTETGLTFNDYVDVFYVTTDVQPTPTIQIQDFVVNQALTRVTVEYEGDQRIGGDSIIIGNSNITGTLTVNGDTTLNGPNLDINSTFVDIGSDDNRAQVHLQGLLHFDDPNEGIVFGPTEEGDPADMSTTTFTVDSAGDLIIRGADLSGGEDYPVWRFDENVDIDVDGTLTADTVVVEQDTTILGDLRIGPEEGPSITISDGVLTSLDENGQPGASIRRVTANDLGDATIDAGVNQELESLTIGSSRFTLPEFTAGVAEALPGLNESFGGIDTYVTDWTYVSNTGLNYTFQASAALQANVIDMGTTVETIFDGNTIAIFRDGGTLTDVLLPIVSFPADNQIELTLTSGYTPPAVPTYDIGRSSFIAGKWFYGREQGSNVIFEGFAQLDDGTLDDGASLLIELPTNSTSVDINGPFLETFDGDGTNTYTLQHDPATGTEFVVTGLAEATSQTDTFTQVAAAPFAPSFNLSQAPVDNLPANFTLATTDARGLVDINGDALVFSVDIDTTPATIDFIIEPAANLVFTVTYNYQPELAYVSNVGRVVTFDANTDATVEYTITYQRADQALIESIFTQYRNNRDEDANQLLFFVGSTNPVVDSTTLVGSTLDGNFAIYEQLAYDAANGIMTYGRFGGGAITIFAEEVTFPGIPFEDFTANHSFVTIDENSELSRSSIAIDARSSGAQYTDTDETNQGLASISFTGHNADGDAGAVTVDTTGRYDVIGDLNLATDLTDSVADGGLGQNTLRAFQLAVLRPITANQTLNLPIGNIGDSIKIINTSTIGDDGAFIADSGFYWSLSPDATQEIKGLNEDLVLNAPTASFELLYVGGVLGWIIATVE